ncbi:MAG: amino acid ABC transporter permease [Thermomicrobiales bacterium]|nr:amino acid ABC transporter permease [Thermomicrobiales bacterium]
MTASTLPQSRELTPEQVRALLQTPPLWRQREVQRSAAIALLSTVIVFGVLGYFISQSSGWAAVQQAFFSPADFVAAFPMVLKGFWLNVRIFLIAEPIILAIGLLLAITRSTRSPVFFPARAAAVTYIDIFRGAPAILVILTLGFGMPALRIPGLPTSAIFWGTVAIILTSSAYQAETFRAGIESVHTSQRAAARSLGLTNGQTLRYVVLPQAIRTVIPPTLSGFVGLQKETALISVIGPLEATRQAQIYAGTTFNFTSYVVAGVLFIAITIPLARFTDYLLHKTAQRRQMGGAV